MLQLSETTGLIWSLPELHGQAGGMACFLNHHQRPPRVRLRQWQQVRTWARLIREAEALWHVDVRAIRRMGAIELTQLIAEVPPFHRLRVNRWLQCYSVSTRLQTRTTINAEQADVDAR